MDGDGAGDWRPMVRDLIHRTERELLTVLDGLAPELIDELPEPGTNSVGRLLWHLTRSDDRNVSELLSGLLERRHGRAVRPAGG